MAYTKTLWKDRVVEKPRNYTKTDNADGTITLTPAPGVVTEAGTPIIAQSLNNMEQGIADIDTQLAAKATKSLSAATYYVNASTGADTNDGLSAGTSFKTIQKAISLIPNVLQYDFTINIADGIYNEDLSISGLSGVGTLFFNGTSRANTQVKSITGMQCKCPIYIQNLSTNINTTDTMKFYRCSFVYIYNCQNNASLASYAFVVFSASRGWVKNCNPSYAYIGIQSMYGSEVLSDNNSGSGNTYVFYSSASTISLGGTQPSGSNTPWLMNGGKICSTQISLNSNGYRINDDGTIEQWAYYGNSLASGSLSVNINFPIAFPNAIYHVDVNVVGGGGCDEKLYRVQAVSPTTTGYNLKIDNNGYGGNYGFAITYRAFGR